MSYFISYNGYVDRKKNSIISGIGVTNIQAGDKFSLAFSDLSGNYKVYIAKETADSEGFIYWENVQELTQVNDSYQVPTSFKIDSKYFFRIQFSDLTIGDAINFIIETDNLKIVKAFLSPKATMLSPTISRKCNNISIKHNYTCANIIGNESATYDHYITTGGKNQGTDLCWYRTNKEDFLSTFCYVKNLHSEPLKLTYTIQGHVVKTDNSGEIWRSPSTSDSGTDSGYGYLSIDIQPYETKLLEYCVKVRNKDEINNGIEPYCWINDSNGKYQKINFSLLFWRFDIGEDNNIVEPSHFIILNEKLRNKGDLANSIIDNNAIELTVIDQQTFK